MNIRIQYLYMQISETQSEVVAPSPSFGSLWISFGSLCPFLRQAPSSFRVSGKRAGRRAAHLSDLEPKGRVNSTQLPSGLLPFVLFLEEFPVKVNQPKRMPFLFPMASGHLSLGARGVVQVLEGRYIYHVQVTNHWLLLLLAGLAVPSPVSGILLFKKSAKPWKVGGV